MHDNELEIDDALVRDLVDCQFPQWSGLPLKRVRSSGTVHVIYRLGTAMSVRLPRLVEYSAALEAEAATLPLLAPLVPLRIPAVAGIGSPTGRYPSPWSILSWIDGETLDTAPVDDMSATAVHLGEFVRAMRAVHLRGRVSPNQRARPLAHSDYSVRSSIFAVASEFDSQRLTSLWEAALQAPEWDGKMAWVHADLLPGNLIVADGELAAVIDFGECAIGNPTYDLIAGWWVFDEPARTVFRRAAGADTASWYRAKGLALSGAVGALAYYRDTNPEFSDAARLTIRRVIDDE